MNKFLLTIMTCDKRTSVLNTTLDSLKSSDWGEEPLVVHDTTRHHDPKISQTTTSYQILQTALTRDGWEYLVFCEDDVLFNRFLRHNLERWTPVRFGMALVGTLYQGGPWEVLGDYSLAPAGQIGGSQAVVLKRSWLPELIRMWPGLHVGMQDMRMYQGVEQYFPYVFVHQPNLVQHAAVPSTWDGPPHVSPTFDQDWKAN
jgi:hypothetical protein